MSFDESSHMNAAIVANGAKVVLVDKLKDLVPEKGYFVSESPEIARLWEEELKQPLYDPRASRREDKDDM